MSRWPDLIEWFHDGPLPSIISDPAIVLGGTSLMNHFFTSVGDLDGPGELAVAAPFVSAGIAERLRCWNTLRHREIDLLLVTASAADAEVCRRELCGFPWRSVRVSVQDALHAKVFAFVNPWGGGMCLVGSHNLTVAATARNYEAGVMFIGTRDRETGCIVRACRDHVEYLASTGRHYVDTLRTLPGSAA